jgi:ankyrin repeat protein
MEVTLARLPDHPNFEYLKKQAKELLRLYKNKDISAFERFRRSLPVAHGKDDGAIAALNLKLRDAQSTIAREYGLPTWRNLRNNVDWRNSRNSDAREDAVPLWLHQVYGHENDRPNPVLAVRMLAQRPDLAAGDLMLACAIGDETGVRAALAADPASISRISNPWHCPGCKEPLGMPPLVAVTHSSLLQLPEFHDRLVRCARLLLDSGVDPNQSWLAGKESLSALFGAAGKNHDPELTRILLEAGANPNDNESLYHSTEAPDLRCTRLLLEAGAKVEGTNAIHHQLDRENVEGLRLLLAYTRDINHVSGTLPNPLIWAIHRGRSVVHIEALLAAGADPHAKTAHGLTAWRLAMQSGLREVAALLERADAGESLSIEELFVSACSACDEPEARRILSTYPDVLSRLSPVHLHLLPHLASSGNDRAVRLMVELGWPIAVTGGDWNASALNHAVFRGDAALARFLLEHGASWQERHGFGDNVNGTLQWASRNRPNPEGDWVACAAALVDYGLPILELDGNYSEEVSAYLARQRSKARDS